MTSDSGTGNDQQNENFYNMRNTLYPITYGYTEFESDSDVQSLQSYSMTPDITTKLNGSSEPSQVRSTSTQSSDKKRKLTEEEINAAETMTLSPVEKRQEQTRQALRRLKSPPATRMWTSEHHVVLSENLNSLLDATRGPTKRLSATIEEEESAWGQPIIPSNKPEGESQSSNPACKSLFPLAKKEKSLDKSPKPLKRQRLDTRARISITDTDIVRLNPQPVQMFSHDHPLKDRDDTWFENEFKRLFQNLTAFFETYFCIHNGDEGHFTQPWAADHNPEFLNYVLQVAEPDPNGGGWDDILRDTKQRKWLLVGILMTVLEHEVFDEDLWGATKEEKELMFGIEKALLSNEGFARAALRAQTVRTILSGRPVTTLFHESVAKLTAQVSLLFQPLLSYLYTLHRPPNTIVPIPWDIHQALHNIISHAAYLSLCIRLSPTIFYFTSLSPGEAYQPDDMLSLESQIFAAGKAVVVREYEKKRNIWVERKQELEGEITALKALGSNGKKKIKTVSGKLTEHEEKKPQHCGYSYRAMTKICAWPNIRRFKPGSLEQEQTGMPLKLMKGFRIYELGKGAAIMYYGSEEWGERRRQSVDLEGFVKEKQECYGKEQKQRHVAGYALGVAAFAMPPALAALERWRGGVAAGLMGWVGRLRGGLVA